ncbi:MULTISPECIES: hypothetical protein [unclassified Bradyrhizobium]
MAHRIATKAAGGVVSTAVFRDVADGTVSYSVTYTSNALRWVSRHRFPDQAQADAGAAALADFLGVEVRR